MDKIVYTVWTLGGGVDGMDLSDKPKPRFCTYDKWVAQRSILGGDDPIIKADVVDIEQARKDALAKLSPLDKLILNLW